MGRLTGRWGQRGWAGASLALLLGILSPGVVSAESTLWTMTASPLVATTGVATTYTLTATNEDPLAALSSNSEIGCVEVTLPLTFSVAAAGGALSSAT